MKTLNLRYDDKAYNDMLKKKKNYIKNRGLKISWEDIVYFAIMSL